ncbi:MAG TPA: hypothetical protein VLL76_02585 [Candidatus Omnitrophota bacterium]|nr:hypothetical protein [Candidatus Omnitrophota bacterium]
MTTRDGEGLARGLGWFSVALGAAELTAPGAICRALGMPGHERLVQGYGVREIATGIALLRTGDPTPWIWGRVAGDALDLASLGAGTTRENAGRAVAAMGAVAAVTALDIDCARRLARVGGTHPDYSDRSGFYAPPESMRGAGL